MTALLLVLLACGGGAPEVQEPVEEPAWGAARVTQQGKYRVAVELEPDPPPLGELFLVRAHVTQADGEPLEDAKVTLDATMPHHGHGMETRPIPDPGECPEEGRCLHPGGVYTSRGFKFHMRGPWTLTVEIEGPRGFDNTSFVYDLE